MLTLAVIYLLVAPTLLMVEHSLTNEFISLLARAIVLIAVAFYAFTVVELMVTGYFRQKDSSYFVGVNLGFSLLRLFLTISLLFILKQRAVIDFTLAFIDVLVFYFITLMYSTWQRQKGNKQDTFHT